MPVKINGTTSGSVTLAAPDSGSDVTLTLPGVTDTLMRQGGGKILQIVRATDTTSRSTTSSTFVDVTGASVTITPQRSDSAVIIAAVGQWQTAMAADTTNFGYIRITDSSNNALSGTDDGRFGVENLSGTGTRQVYGSFHLWGYATPATTSSVTYKLRFRAFSSSTTMYVRGDAAATQMYAIEVSA